MARGKRQTNELRLAIRETTGKGRGIFTELPVANETIIEVAPVIVMSAGDRKLLDQTRLHDYIFEWGDDSQRCAMALGWVSIYNHASPGNCDYFMDFDEETIMIRTVRDIGAGEELTINYNGDWDNEDAVWFEALQQ